MPLPGYISTDGPYTGLTKEELIKCAYKPVWVRLRCVLLFVFWISWIFTLATAILIVVFAPKCQAPAPLQWWQIKPVYQLYSPSFQDGIKPNDGMGDIPAIRKINHLKETAEKVGLQISFETKYMNISDGPEWMLTDHGKIGRVKFKYLVEVIQENGLEQEATNIRIRKLKRAFQLTKNIYNKNQCMSLLQVLRYREDPLRGLWNGWTTNEKEWWRHHVIYQIYPRSFKDSNGDGIGDLKGIESRLDYIQNLGIGAVWLSPIYKSPMKDFGYDIQDFKDIAPEFGTMEDFRSLSRAMRERGIKLVLDFVPNHSSDLHEWFQKSVKRVMPYTDYYMWLDPKGFDDEGKPIPPNNWKSVFGGSAWEWNEDRKQFYLHQFLKEQPDLNYRNPLILQEMKDVLQFWLDQGVDGFRVDAAAHMFEDEEFRDEPYNDKETSTEYSQLDHIFTYNLPEVLDVLREFRILLDKNSVNESKIMFVEAYLPVNKVMDYYGNASAPVAHFPFNFEFISSIKQNITAKKVYDVIKTWQDNLPDGAWSNWVVGNHDNSRVATRFGADLVDAINMIILLLPGTPVTYYGEELGMEDTQISWEDTKDTAGLNAGPEGYQLESRDPERTPMQWNAGKNAGFSEGNTTWLPVNPNYVTLNVEAQLKADWSHLKVYQLLAEARKAEAIMTGELDIHVLKEDILVFTRIKEGVPGYMVVVNFSNATITLDLTTVNRVPDSSTVYVFSTTYTDYFHLKDRIANTAVTMPGRGGVVLTFVPGSQEHRKPIPL